jgi:hypothetical protein
LVSNTNTKTRRRGEWGCGGGVGAGGFPCVLLLCSVVLPSSLPSPSHTSLPLSVLFLRSQGARSGVLSSFFSLVPLVVGVTTIKVETCVKLVVCAFELFRALESSWLRRGCFLPRWYLWLSWHLRRPMVPCMPTASFLLSKPPPPSTR